MLARADTPWKGDPSRKLTGAILAGLTSGLLLAGASLGGALGPLVFVALLPFLGWVDRSEAGGVPGALAGLSLGLALFGAAALWVPVAGYGGGLLGLLALYVVLLSLPLALLGALLAALRRRSRGAALAAAPLCWVLLEGLRDQGPWGYPWHHVGYSLGDWPALLAPAAFLGVYGLSLWIVSTNALIVGLRGRRAPARIGAAAAALSPLLVGLLPPGQAGPGPALRIAAIQPAIATKAELRAAFEGAPESDSRFRSNLTRLVDLTARASRDRPDLVVWPETSFERTVTPLGDPLLGGIARTFETTLLVGARHRAPDGTLSNAAVLTGADGSQRRVGDKVRLFPVWEAAPTGSLARWLAAREIWRGRLRPGERAGLVQVGSVRVGVLICLDTADPGLTRALRLAGAELLIELSNDGAATSWVAQQHARISRVRAVESGLALVRAANTGPSELVSPSGEPLALLAPGSASVLTGTPPPGRPPTLFVRFGHAPAIALGLLPILPFVPQLRLRPRARRDRRRLGVGPSTERTAS